jgi:hypothetical protein
MAEAVRTSLFADGEGMAAGIADGVRVEVMLYCDWPDWRILVSNGGTAGRTEAALANGLTAEGVEVAIEARGDGNPLPEAVRDSIGCCCGTSSLESPDPLLPGVGLGKPVLLGLKPTDFPLLPAIPVLPLVSAMPLLGESGGCSCCC